MSVGFKTYTPNGVEQLNSNIPNLRVIARGVGSASSTVSTVPIPDTWPEPPLLLVRLSPGVFISGGCLLSPNPGGSSLNYQSTGSFEWAVCSTKATPIVVGSGKVGLKLWSPSGELIFSPQYKYPRIQNILSMPSPPYSQSTASRATAFSNWQKMPWLVLTDSTVTNEVSFGEYSYPAFVYSVSVNSSFNVLTVMMRNTDDFAPNGYKQSDDVFVGRLMRFPMCDIPGL